LAKAASVGILPVLAAGVLTAALAGCGGGSDSSTTVSAEGSTEKVSTGGTTGAPDKPSPAEEEQAKAAAKAKAAGKKAKAGKHGPAVSRPEGEREPEITPEQRAESTVADITLSSPALQSNGTSTSTLPAAYTCDGKDGWPALEWQDVPAGTAELALFAMNVQPVKERIFFDWALAGLDPALGGLEAGSLPKGVVTGKNSFGQEGYSICPPQGEGETYMFVLYALPKPLGPKQGFDPLALREEALKVSGNAGLMAASYSRG
jgi:phosphatidylethanolamine-binding protein (PEBP) family uncharacterized protein